MYKTIDQICYKKLSSIKIKINRIKLIDEMKPYAFSFFYN